MSVKVSMGLMGPPLAVSQSPGSHLLVDSTVRF